MHDVFIVDSEASGRGRIVRIVHAASEDDARQTHEEHYPRDSIMEIATQSSQLTSISKSTH